VLGKGRPPHHLSGSRKKALPAPFLPSARTNASPTPSRWHQILATTPCCLRHLSLPEAAWVLAQYLPQVADFGGRLPGPVSSARHPWVYPPSADERAAAAAGGLQLWPRATQGIDLEGRGVFLRRGHGHITDKYLLLCWTDNSGRRRGRRATTPKQHSSSRQQLGPAAAAGVSVRRPSAFWCAQTRL
jgi:hypothetical protein